MDVTSGGHDSKYRQPSSSSRWLILPPAKSCSKVACFLLILDITNGAPKYALPPQVPGRPFLIYWNIPTEQCSRRWHVNLPLQKFHIISNHKEQFRGKKITILYSNQAGLYPKFDEHTNVPSNGAVPQNVSLPAHLNQLVKDIKKYIPHEGFQGLAIIDWEEWRPQWVRNWSKKDIYRRTSQDIVRARHPDWSEKEITKQAKLEFDTAARNFMTESLKTSIGVYPKALWGYYLFPDCYNYDYKKNFDTYTGNCPDIEYSRNNNLVWMWGTAKALFPSIYMEEKLGSTIQGKKFIRGKVKEAVRAAGMSGKKYAVPIFFYARSHYSFSFKPMTEVSGSASLGGDGIVLWGSSEYSRSTVRKLVNCSSLGPYLVNVSLATQFCSKTLCHANGRCIRKNPEADVYLHLKEDTYRSVVNRADNTLYPNLKRKMISRDRKILKSDFKCQCYLGFKGKHCERGKAVSPFDGKATSLHHGCLIYLDPPCCSPSHYL
uniref:Hyaluronidase n=1 Tax=Callorhinchus milii TaxID=7868 RepID=A0A4W3KKM9_CALMI